MEKNAPQPAALEYLRSSLDIHRPIHSVNNLQKCDSVWNFRVVASTGAHETLWPGLMHTVDNFAHSRRVSLPTNRQYAAFTFWLCLRAPDAGRASPVAVHKMGVDHPNGLHQGVHRGWSNEHKSALTEGLGQGD